MADQTDTLTLICGVATTSTSAPRDLRSTSNAQKHAEILTRCCCQIMTALKGVKHPLNHISTSSKSSLNTTKINSLSSKSSPSFASSRDEVKTKVKVKDSLNQPATVQNVNENNAASNNNQKQALCSASAGEIKASGAATKANEWMRCVIHSGTVNTGVVGSSVPR